MHSLKKQLERIGYSHLFLYPVIGSTNDEAKEFVKDPFTYLKRGGEGEWSLVDLLGNEKKDESDSTFLYIPLRVSKSRIESAFWAISQSSGRGRLGRTWQSPSGAGIYMTFLAEAKSDPSLLAIAAGSALCEALRQNGFEALVKWPNDIHVGGKKVAGILSELVSDGAKNYVLVGVGLNLAMEFSGELRSTASDLLTCSGSSRFQQILSRFGASENKCGIANAEGQEKGNEVFARAELLRWGAELVSETVGRMVFTFWELEKSKFIDYARKYSATINREVEVHPVHDGSGYCARAVDICENGALLVELSSGERREIFAGEVTLRRERAADI